MKKFTITVFFFLAGILCAQSDSLAPVAGNKAPSFILRDGNTIQSITMPYMKKIILLNFWSSTDIVARLYNDWLKRITRKYRYASYRNAEGFEVIAIAVQTDRAGWKEAIKNDSLTDFIHGIAEKGFLDQVCVKYDIQKIPSRVLIDETGTILSVDPGMLELENILDDKRNFRPVTRNISGILAQSSNKKDPLKYSNVYLFSYYGDSLGRTLSAEDGSFVFEELNLSHEYVLKVDNKIDILTSDPIALYTTGGDFITDGRTRNEGFVFPLLPRVSNRLVIRSDSLQFTEGLEVIDVIKSLTFSGEGSALTAGDKRELQHIVTRLKSNPALKLELITHTDVRTEPVAALEETSRQASALKDFFQEKGISSTRIKAIAKGNSEPRKFCDGSIDCREEDHLLNRRVEFMVYKD